MDSKTHLLCQICENALAPKHLAYKAHAIGDWPARYVIIQCCPACYMWIAIGLINCSSQKVERIRKNLQRVTGRPWQWSVSNIPGTFTIAEASIIASGSGQKEQMEALEEEIDTDTSIFRYGAPF